MRAAFLSYPLALALAACGPEARVAPAADGGDHTPDGPDAPDGPDGPDAGGREARPRDAAPPPDASREVAAEGCGFAAVVPRALFDTLFPLRYRHPLFTYEGLLEAIRWADGLPAFRGFARTGDPNTCRREVAAFLAHVGHETGTLGKAEETDKKPYCRPAADCACDPDTPDQSRWYFGRGPLQLSHNYHYCRAGRELGADLHRQPGLLATDPVLTWKSALWFWMSRRGAGVMTCHQAMTDPAHGFGETIRTINGGIDCGNPEKVRARVERYLRYLRLLGGVPESAGRLGC